MNSFISKGSEWRRWDLHFHTPSSFDYHNKSITNEEIITTLKNNNISVVAITDHHFIDVNRIKELQRLGHEYSITVLPGIECCSELGGSQPIHFIGIFSEKDDVVKIWDTIKIKAGIQNTLDKKKDIEKIYCKFEDTCKCIQELGGIITLHAGTKTNTVEAINNNFLTNQEFKTDILSNFNPILEVNKTKNIDEYNKIVFPKIGFNLPVIICSDNHNVKDYHVNEITWIKADPTFEGLKQVLYEPKERVRVQSTQPDDRPNYSYISKIELKDDTCWNQDLYLNKNLNVIIGGRSTGKSTLLTSIARKFQKDEKNLPKNDTTSFINLLKDKIEIYWGNGTSDYNKEVCFIEQNEMIKIAQSEKEKKAFLEQFMYDNDRKRIFDNYHFFIKENSIKIQTNIANLFMEYNDENSLLDEIKTIGKRKEIEEEKTKLDNEKKEILSQLQFDESILKNFEEIQDRFSQLNEKEKLLDNTKKELVEIVSENIFYHRDIVLWGDVDDNYEQKLKTKIDELDEKVNKTLKTFIFSLINEIEEDINQINNKKDIMKKSESYIIGNNYLENNKKISILNSKINIEEQKIKQIKEKEEKINLKKKRINQLSKDIINKFLLFKEKNEELINQISFESSEIEFFVTNSFNSDKLYEFLSLSFDMRGNNPINNVINMLEKGNHDELLQFIEDINKKDKKYSLKPTTNKEEFLKSLFSTNWYDYQYDIKYEEDTFSKMSPGKQAFIILRLLLNVSTKDCPILIDQPEDSLDNRAIYHELVKYIRQTKTKRQLILVTHNPNIVVGSDAELVIVANQHGSTNKNSNEYKFQYKSGSLESDNKEKDTNITLDKMNIREHICDILEGGKEAFEHREKKYGFK